MIVKGRNRDTAWFAMLDGEWPARKAAFERWLRRDNFDGAGRQKESLTSLTPARGRMSAMGWIVHGVLSVAAGYVVISLVANAIHRWPSHDPRWKDAGGLFWPFGEIFRRHALHHRSFARFDRPAHRDGSLYALDIDGRVTAAMVALIAAPLLLVDWVSAVAMAAAVVLHNHVYNAIHSEMHAPRGRWFAGAALFRYYAWYHFLHHRHAATRFNSAFPLADWLLGTLGTATEFRPAGVRPTPYGPRKRAPKLMAAATGPAWRGERPFLAGDGRGDRRSLDAGQRATAGPTRALRPKAIYRDFIFRSVEIEASSCSSC